MLWGWGRNAARKKYAGLHCLRQVVDSSSSMFPKCQGRYYFSDFLFDPRSGDLSRNGARLRITEQARHVLAALLEDAGNIVSRQQLQQRLWPRGEHLDWDRAITKLVVQLREILRDDARESRFIETVAKRGYRFIAPVCFEPESAEPETAAPPQKRDQALIQIGVGASPSESTTEVTTAGGLAIISPSQRRTFPRQIAVPAVLILIMGTVAMLMDFQPAKRESSYSHASIGIPPFEASGEGSQGVAESFRLDLANAVAELPTVQVRAAHSFSAPLRDYESIHKTAHLLQLDLLLFGRMTVSGDAFILNLELVRGRDAVHLASYRYSGSIEELDKAREKIQRDLFEELGLAGQGPWRTQASTANPKAYQAYLQARLDLAGWSDAPVEKALDEFQRAIDEDPKFANAYAGLASTYVLLGDHGAAPFESSYRKAEEAAARAIQLAPSTAEGHAILGEVALRRDWNFELAERELRRAVELDPNRAGIHLWLSVLLCYRSRFSEALREIDSARTADPLWAPVYGTEAFLASAAGQTPRATQASEKLTALMPNWPAAFDQRGWAYWYAGRYTDAIADWRHMAQMENDPNRIRLEDEGLEAFRRGGIAAYARVRLKAIQSGYPYRHATTDFVAAEWYSIGGDRDKAVAELERMLARHDPLTLQLAANTAFIPLRNDPRFTSILTRVGLNQPKLRLANDNLAVAGNEAALPNPLHH